MTMKLYHWPGSCSTGIHVLLHELGATFDNEVINLPKGDQMTPEYRAISPSGKVPTLVRDDGSVLTEFQTIAFWLGSAHPEARLLPEDLEQRTRIMEALDFMVGSVHMRGYTFILATGKFLSDPEGQATLQAHGRDIVRKGLDRLAEMLGDKPYLFGDFSIADAGLFYICRFAARAQLTLPPALQQHHDRMLRRPSVQKVMMAEGTA